MKSRVVFGFLVSGLVVAVVCAAENKYNSKYDTIDVDRILSNDRVLTSYIKCAMEEGPCTPDGRELKSMYILNYSTNI